jgi:hypothetical protein
MYNSNIPSNEELPSTAKLIKSTLLALVVAGILLVTVVMPSEYGIDPTGIGQTLGLKNMGEIKQSLVLEAEADALAHSNPAEEKESHGRDNSNGDHHHGEKEEQSKSTKQLINESKPKGHHHGDGKYHQH